MTNILVVDDTCDAAEVLALLFEARGHEVHVAYDGAQGLAATSRYLPHIIFLDLDMPVLDGFAAARAIRSAPNTDRLFIVALSAKTGDDIQARTRAAGFDFYVPKPADTDALLALVDDLQGRERLPA